MTPATFLEGIVDLLEHGPYDRPRLGRKAWNSDVQQCRQGHAYDELNTRRRANGKRYCAECSRERKLKAKALDKLN